MTDPRKLLAARLRSMDLYLSEGESFTAAALVHIAASASEAADAIAALCRENIALRECVEAAEAMRVEGEKMRASFTVNASTFMPEVTWVDGFAGAAEAFDAALERVAAVAGALTEADVRRIVNDELRRFEQSHYKLFGVDRDGD